MVNKRLYLRIGGKGELPFEQVTQAAAPFLTAAFFRRDSFQFMNNAGEIFRRAQVRYETVLLDGKLFQQILFHNGEVPPLTARNFALFLIVTSL